MDADDAGAPIGDDGAADGVADAADADAAVPATTLASLPPELACAVARHLRGHGRELKAARASCRLMRDAVDAVIAIVTVRRALFPKGTMRFLDGGGAFCDVTVGAPGPEPRALL